MKMDKYTSPVSYSSAGFMAFLGTVTLNEWAIIIGMITGVATFAINWYYKRAHDRREEKKAQALIKMGESRFNALPSSAEKLIKEVVSDLERMK